MFKLFKSFELSESSDKNRNPRNFVVTMQF